jgi:hypothetical protein
MQQRLLLQVGQVGAGVRRDFGGVERLNGGSPFAEIMFVKGVKGVGVVDEV